jgi:bifunctional non-homologous end joining protein LigD
MPSIPFSTGGPITSLCFIDAGGQANFRKLHGEMRTRWPNQAQLMFMVYDLLHQDGVDLRQLPLSERKRDLDRLCRKARIPFMRLVETFPDGAVLFEHCGKFGFEGVVSKRIDAGTNRHLPQRHPPRGGHSRQ